MPDTRPAAPATATDTPPALPLQRFTTAYDTEQDRIRLTGQGADKGPVHTLWITQRLMRRLLPKLWQWLELNDAPRTQLGPATAAYATALHEMAQHAACAQRPASPEAPVAPGPFSPQWLVCSVQLRASAQAVELLLANTGDDNAPLPLDHASAQLTFTAQLLRQWLAILLQLHQQADWPLDQWPQWLAAPAQPPQTATERPVLH